MRSPQGWLKKKKKWRWIKSNKKTKKNKQIPEEKIKK